MRFSLGAAFMVAGVAAGYVTGVEALGRAGKTAAPGANKWTQEMVNPKDAAAIYATGHFLAEGLLPPPRDTLYFTRLADDDGKTLRADCSYRLSGPEPAARWWSVSAMPADGAGAGVSFSASDAVLTGDDRLELSLSHHAAAGNWLVLPESGNLKVALVFNAPYDKTGKGPTALPTLQRVSCE